VSCLLSRDEIERKMAAIRGNLDGEVGGIVQNARRLVDWRHYVRSFPLSSLAAVATAGYLAVPHLRPRATVAATPQLTTPQSPRPVEAPAASDAEVTGGVLSALAGMTTKWAVRTALQFAGQRLASHLSRKHQGAPDRTMNHDRN